MKDLIIGTLMIFGMITMMLGYPNLTNIILFFALTIYFGVKLFFNEED